MKKSCISFVLVVWISLLAAGCSEFHSKRVDKITNKTLKAGDEAALGKTRPVNFEYSPLLSEGDKDKYIQLGDKKIPLGFGDTVKLSLNECLEISYRNSRRIQNSKENLYSAAMSLANNRRSWDFPLADMTLAGDTSHEKINNGAETNSAFGESKISLTQRFVNGGILSAAFAVNAATNFLNSNNQTFGSLFEANFTQPILRGAWRNLAYENLYRQERDFLFSIFEYERFTQTFAVSIVSSYYSVLRQRDSLENDRMNIESLKDTYEFTKVQADAGLISQVQADQAQQDLLNSQISLQTSEQAYEDAVDNFKILLGLPIIANMTIDYENEKELLQEAGPKPMDMNLDAAVGVAMVARADVLRRKAGLRDAYRDVVIAEDQFNPGLDLVMGITATDNGENRSARTQFGDHARFVGLEFNYSLDQFDNAENYRNSIINLSRTQRDLDEFEDGVVLSVRQAYRSLIRSRKNYELQLLSVAVAERRSMLAREQQKNGQASLRDVLEAQDALLRSKNGLIASLISYTTTRLEFLADIGMIEVDANGLLLERTKPQEFDIIARRYKYVSKNEKTAEE